MPATSIVGRAASSLAAIDPSPRHWSVTSAATANAHVAHTTARPAPRLESTLWVRMAVRSTAIATNISVIGKSR
jgi:hypothetical protein